MMAAMSLAASAEVKRSEACTYVPLGSFQRWFRALAHEATTALKTGPLA